MNDPAKKNESLIAALRKAEAAKFSAVPAEEAVEHTFSAGFQKKMGRLIRVQRTSFWQLVNTPQRRAVFLFAVLILTFGVRPDQNPLFRYARPSLPLRTSVLPPAQTQPAPAKETAVEAAAVVTAESTAPAAENQTPETTQQQTAPPAAETPAPAVSAPQESPVQTPATAAPPAQTQAPAVSSAETEDPAEEAPSAESPDDTSAQAHLAAYVPLPAHEAAYAPLPAQENEAPNAGASGSPYWPEFSLPDWGDMDD